MATKKRELFDATEYTQKMDLMIEKLRTRPPGEAVGQVGKNDILAMRREALQQLIKDGYTIQQIAEAIKEDIFSILPKTITEIVTPKKSSTAATTKTVKAARKTATTAETVAAKETEQVKNKTINKRNSTNNFVDIE